MRMCSIASGSSGNCIYIGTDATHLLVDVGISCLQLIPTSTRRSVASVPI